MNPASEPWSRPGRDALPLRLLRFALLAAGLVHLAVYLGIALRRIGYPFALEWMEGATLDSVRRVAAGLPLFVEPTVDFIPLTYSPLYYFVSAPLFQLMGPGFLPLRLVSFVASLGCLALIFVIVRRETRDTFAAALASLLFVATYEMTSAWFDLARADSLNLLLLLAGFAWLAFDHSRLRGPVIAGLLLGLAYLAKQSALPASLPLVVYLLVTRRSRGLALAAAMAAVIAGSTLAFNLTSQGWYGYYVSTVALGHGFVLSWIPYFWIHDLGRLVLAVSVAVAYFVLARPAADGAATGDDRRGLFAAWAIGLVGTTWWLRLYPGSAANIVIPAAAAIAVCCGLGWAAIAERCRARASEPTARAVQYLMCVACLLQLVGLGYYPTKYVPTAADRAAGEAMVRYLSLVPGEVLVPCHSYLAPLAGKPGHYHAAALADVFRAGRGEPARRLEANLLAALAARRYSAIVADEGEMSVAASAERDYRFERRFFTDRVAFWTLCGARTRPEMVFVPRGDVPDSAGVRSGP